MRFEEKEVTTYGNSNVIRMSNFEKGEKVFILDEEMLEFIRGEKLEK